jgi:hypothetical protein
MNCSDFTQPEDPPYGMLRGYSNQIEKEAILQMLLKHCLDEGDLSASIELQYYHPTMVMDGLLEKTGKNTYKLTKKSIGLLYSVYGE